MKTNLKILETDRPKLDDLTTSEIIGRDASPVTELVAPKFSDHSTRAVSFGRLKSILKNLNK